MASHVRNTAVLSGQLVLDLVDGVVLDVDGTNEQVVGDVVKVTTEFEPGPCGADVICGALALDLDRRVTSTSDRTILRTEHHLQ